MYYSAKTKFDFQVAWIRVDTQTILSMNELVVSRNPRFAVSQTEGKEWHLYIKSVKPSDQAGYMCQINTATVLSTTGYLEVRGNVGVRYENKIQTSTSPSTYLVFKKQAN